MTDRPKEHPIIFNAEMARAILEGRKTHTRRVVKPQPTNGCKYIMNGSGSMAIQQGDIGQGNPPLMMPFVRPKHKYPHLLPCPYGKPGDRLWVREKCCAISSEEGRDCVVYPADNGVGGFPNTPEGADAWSNLHEYGGRRGATVPSIHMPRWASRITLEVTDVRVERVQEITNEDAAAEGVLRPFKNTVCGCAGEFAKLWDSINGSRGYSWEANPWVWVIEFKNVERKHD